MAGAMTFEQALMKILAGKGGDDAQKSFDAKVAEIAKRDGIPEHEAMRTARAEHPAAFDALQASASSSSSSAQGDPTPDPMVRKQAEASAAFVAKSEEIAKRDGVPGYVAMSRARTEHPELFDALG
jgi:hypothetical protein